MSMGNCGDVKGSVYRSRCTRIQCTTAGRWKIVGGFVDRRGGFIMEEWRRNEGEMFDDFDDDLRLCGGEGGEVPVCGGYAYGWAPDGGEP